MASDLPPHIPMSVLESDRFLDVVLDQLEHAAEQGQLNLARWDLKHAIRQSLGRVYNG